MWGGVLQWRRSGRGGACVYRCCQLRLPPGPPPRWAGLRLESALDPKPKASGFETIPTTQPIQISKHSKKVTTKKGYDLCRKADFVVASAALTDRTFAGVGETTVGNLKTQWGVTTGEHGGRAFLGGGGWRSHGQA